MSARNLQLAVYTALGAALFGIILAIVHLLQVAVSSYSSSTTAGSGRSTYFSSRNSIMLLSLNGVIQAGNEGENMEHIVNNLELSKNNSNIRAVLLTINSPGGTVATTKRVYEKVLEVRKTKPVVALIGDLAASGGYYIASACTSIIASEGSTLGSIGVISVHMEVHRFLERHGVKATVIKAGRYKDIGSPFRGMTGEERRMYQSHVNEFYALFLKDVAAGRKKKLSKVRTWAEGKIFSAGKALKLGMIDGIGHRNEAITEIKKLLKTEDDLKIVEPEKNFEYYIKKYFLSTFMPSISRTVGYEKILQAPLLYLYPHTDFYRALGSLL